MIKVLFVCPYENIYPPSNGGMQRSFHLINQAAVFFKLTALIGQDPASFRMAEVEYPAIRSAQIIRSVSEDQPIDLFSLLPKRFKDALRYRWYKKTVSNGTDTLFLKYYFSIRKLLSKEKFDAVILSNVSLVGLSALVRKMNPTAAIIFDAHNVDSSLAADLNRRGLVSDVSVKRLLAVESAFGDQLDAVTACSDNDLEQLKKLNKGNLKGRVVPNAAVLQAIDPANIKDVGKSMRILFCGSLNYEPNREGLIWFIRGVWPLVRSSYPDAKFMVVGSGNPDDDFKSLLGGAGIEFAGYVNELKSFYNRVSVAIAPLLTGSGTRLKVLEAMGYGVPVVSTSKGAEGIHYSDGSDILIADDVNAFAEKILLLLNASNFRSLIAANARLMIKKKYNWEVSGKLFCDFVEHIVDFKKLSLKSKNRSCPNSVF